MKTCSRCGKTRKNELFGLKNGKLHSWCKICVNEENSKQYRLRCEKKELADIQKIRDNIYNDEPENPNYNEYNMYGKYKGKYGDIVTFKYQDLIDINYNPIEIAMINYIRNKRSARSE